MRKINLKSLIRFEDSYGLTDIFCARQGREYFEWEGRPVILKQADDVIFVSYGLASAWTLISDEEAFYIMELGIERIINVYDMDNLKGNKKALLSLDNLKKTTETFESRFKGLGYNIEILYVPVVYAAETLALHQFLKNSKVLQITDLVNYNDTWKMHLYMLAYLTGNNPKEAKKMRNFLDIELLVESFKFIPDTDPNKMCKNWIAEGCNINSKVMYGGVEAVKHLEYVTTVFARLWSDCRDNRKEIEFIDGVVIDMYNMPVPIEVINN